LFNNNNNNSHFTFPVYYINVEISVIFD